LKSGKIGKLLLGNGGNTTPKPAPAPPKPAPKKKAVWVPLTLDEVLKQLPRQYFDFSRDKNNFSEHEGLDFYRKHRFGPYLHRFTLGIARQLIGKEIYIMGGQTPVFGNPRGDIDKAVIHKIIRHNGYGEGKDEITLIMSESNWEMLYSSQGGVETKQMGWGRPDETDHWGIEVPKDEKDLHKLADKIFSADSIPLYVFVREVGEQTSTKKPKQQPPVNASRRQTSTGTAQKTPTGRKSPAGHAKNFANKTAVGLDGQMWISKQGPSGRWTWRRV